jgi:hypothetical protein
LERRPVITLIISAMTLTSFTALVSHPGGRA